MASKTVKINDQISLVIYEGTSQIRIIDNERNKAYVLKSDAIVDNDLNINLFDGIKTVVEDLIPIDDSQHDLGSPTNRWKDLYLSGNSLFIGDVVLTAEGSNLKVNDLSLADAVGASIDTVDYNNLLNKPNLSVYQLSSEAFSGSYTDLTNRPLLFSGSYNDLTDKPVLFGGSYNDLTDKPVLFGGSYNDLTDKPAIPNLTGYATETFVNSSISNLVNTAPETLNTLNELAAALNNDPNFATTISTQLGNKANSADLALVALSGSYTDLINLPTIPSNTSNLINDSGFITASSTSTLTNKSGNISQWTNDSGYITISSVPSSLLDLGISDGLPGQVLSTNGNGVFTFTTISGGGENLALNELTDVLAANPSDGDILVYNRGVWTSTANTGGGGAGLGSRVTRSGTTITLGDQDSGNIDITDGFKGYIIYKIQTDAAAWVRVYSDDIARSIDSGRNIDTDPINVFGLISEVVTTTADTVKLTPGVIGFNDDSPVSNSIYLNVTNLSSSLRTITVTLTLIQLEA